MSEDKYVRQLIKERRYEGKSEYLGAFGLAGVFIAVGILAIVFYIVDIDFIGLKHWGYYLFIPAFFIVIGASAGYIKYKRLRKEVMATIDNYQNTSVKIDDLAQELMMERASLMRLLIDLRVDMYLKFRVDSKTGDVIFGESYTPPAIDTVKTPITTTDHFYCPQCGQRISADSMFCPNCGASVK
ncbi:MAG: zinc-ribbon domain-containing protein [Candidatus Helarchaeota archaeon]|nr:zinc-ribbon domain-containing protein [Candidatus Helarchaeota archaeon]